ncbi:MAG TPA: nickel pincer cofactor biosynthesis protein LarC [Gemmatimonadales bacterium]|nr:nickel pincer cofactor biosynthesis protein LarC [Gemmatimonadales bacterium]
MRIAILDPAAGISGDMLLGALIDAGAPVERLQDLPERLGLAGQVTVDVERVVRGGVSATKVNVRLADGSMEAPSEPAVATAHAHAHTHGGRDDTASADEHEARHHDHHHGAHRHVSDLVRIVEAAQVSAWVRAKALEAFRALGEAEGTVHGVAWDHVHLHEVGALDALVDIVGGIEGFELLGVQRIFSRPVAIGNGWVRAAHGVLPVPAPATLALLTGIEVGPDGPVTGEATTPTGAVLLKVLSAGSPPARWRALRTGWGAGGRDPHEYSNTLRVVIAEGAAEAAEVAVLAADVDDLSPEYLEPLRDALVAAGALDVQTWPTQMKKGRIGFRLEIITAPVDVPRVTEALFRHSSTAGVRQVTAERITLGRRELTVPGTDHAPVRVKILDGPGGPTVKPEYDDVRAAARQSGRPAHEVAREVAERARAAIHGAGDHGPTTNQER